jgi:flavin reductase (DIM6/NTAB) family NADH-FMN oxidoreductase RutF
MRKEVDTFQYVKETNELLRKDGIFLVTQRSTKKPNIMTIGWGFLGTMWSRPVFVIAVRHSRYTYKLLEGSDSFTVCLPNSDMQEALDICGTKSGRDLDKFTELDLTPIKSHKVNAPYIGECPVHFECRIIYRDDLEPGTLKKNIEDKVYPSKNMHMLYYGEIVGTYAKNGARAHCLMV